MGAIAALIAALVVLFAFRDSILVAAGEFLAREDPVDATPPVLVLPEGLVPDLSRRRLVEHITVAGPDAPDAPDTPDAINESRRVLVLQDAPGRLQRLGIVQPSGEALRAELLELGVPDAAFELIPYGDVPLAYSLENLQRWLDRHPRVGVSLACGRLEARACRAIADRVLTPEAAQRTRIVAVEVNGINETNWWKSRAGLRACMGGFADWIHAEFIGGEAVPAHPDSPRAHIRRLLGEAP